MMSDHSARKFDDTLKINDMFCVDDNDYIVTDKDADGKTTIYATKDCISDCKKPLKFEDLKVGMILERSSSDTDYRVIEIIKSLNVGCSKVNIHNTRLNRYFDFSKDRFDTEIFYKQG